MHPGDSWDLRSYRQKPEKTTCKLIKHFSKQCTKLPNVTNFDVIRAFIVGTTCKELVYELSHKTPFSTSELLDIATNFTSREEAVGAIFPDNKSKGK